MAQVIDPLAYVVIGAALAYAGWAAVEAARDRRPSRALFTGAAGVLGLLLVQSVIAVVRLVAGADVDTGLFLGYLVTTLSLLPFAAYLADLEPTRWGSAILGAGSVVVAPLVLRLMQIWAAGG